MTFFDVDTSDDKSRKSSAKILGTIMLISGIAFVTWCVAELIYVSNGIRVETVYGDVISMSRLVIGTLGILGGIVVMKNEDWSTIKP